MRHGSLAWFLISCSLIASATGLADEGEFEGWSKGDAIPVYLLGLEREVEWEDVCLAGSHEPYCAVAGISNYQLLLAIVADGRTRSDIRFLAAEQALVTLGPTRFFGDLELVTARPESAASRRALAKLRRRSLLPHALVDVLSLSQKDFAAPEVEVLRAQIESQLTQGESWSRILSALSDRFRLPDRCTTRVRNVGSFVINKKKHDAEPLRAVRLPHGHVRVLLATPPGSVVTLQTPEGTDHHHWYIYFVREIYRPRATVGALSRDESSERADPDGLVSFRSVSPVPARRSIRIR